MTLENTWVYRSPREGSVINISAHRLLCVYLLLSQSDRISFEDLNTHLLNHPMVQRTLTHETLNKYIHTLRLFGCVIERFEEQGHVMYRMEEHPLKLELRKKELTTINNIVNSLSMQPLYSISNGFCALVKQLSRIDLSHEIGAFLSPALKMAMEAGLSEDECLQIEQLQRYCYEGQVLEIRYETKDHQSILKLLEPHEVVCYKRRLYLIGKDSHTHKKIRYPFTQIQSIRQLPNRIRSQPVKTIVTFKLTGRLAYNYRPYPGETVLNKGEFLLVHHATDEVEQLLRRLLKYGTACQIISPASAKQEMLKLIDSLLIPLESSN